MSSKRTQSPLAKALREVFGDRLRESVPMAPYTSIRIGGPVDFLLEAQSADELAEMVRHLWDCEAPFQVLGMGSNILISDAGMRGVVVLNRARALSFDMQSDGPSVTAESGAMLGSMARRAVERGLGGLEWATTIPGTVGGAVVGNSGAHGSDIAGSLMLAEILQHKGGKESWSVERLEYAYRDSWLKRNPGAAVVLSATFRLHPSTTELAKASAAEHAAFRKQTQPKGASWGSTFKNPPDDSAGRLIEAAGLKGLQRGDMQVSPKHANFFVNLGNATAEDARKLIDIVRKEVAAQFGVELDLEIQLLGEWGSKHGSPEDAEGDQS
ncbi:MAG TPA: UDP-N-acetylmuramate dehydrogenase [Anaerolineae bacterium]|nr:UDP-N-acetylmuramate dehydrogenase [Anaerolineae bacterium]